MQAGSEDAVKTYTVEGMTCGGCVRSVEKVVQALDPALVVKVDLARGALEVEGEHSVEAVRDAVEKAGFDFSEAAPG